MGFYERRIFPFINDKVMADPQIEKLRKEALASAVGRVLEVGIGTGLNIPLYPATVQTLIGIDPNVDMHARAHPRAEHAPFPVEVHGLSGETLPFDDESFDTVVSTFVLCSIDGVEQALQQIRRVLKPGGRFLLLEHGLSDDPKTQVWQRRLNPIQRVVACGCRLDRDVRALVTDAGFHFETLRTFPMENMPKTHSFVYLGCARRT